MSDKSGDKNVANIEELIQEYKTYNDLDGIQDLSIYVNALENILADYTRQKQINEEHQKINGELREKVKQLEAKLEFQKFGDLDNIEFEEYMNQFIPKQKVKEIVEEVIKLIESEQFKVIMGDLTKVYRIRYLLGSLLEGEK